MAQPITAGLVIETKDLMQEARNCLDSMAVRTLFEQAVAGDLASLAEKLERVRPDALLVDFTRLREPYQEFIAAVKTVSAPPFLIALHSSADPDTILAVIRAGADEYVYPPVAANLPKALARLEAERDKQRQNQAGGKAGRAIGFLSAKGGCGATTIACHTAVELARQSGQEVLLADFDLDAGLIGFLMKSKSHYSILDAVGNTHRLDASYWRALVSNGVPRLQVIRAPGVTVQREEPKEDDVRTVLRFVRHEYGWTVVDLGRGLKPMVLSAIDELDETFVITTLDVPALHQVKEIARGLLDYGYGSDRLRLVLNRMPKNPDIMPGELEDLLGVPVYAMLPDDYGAIYEAYAEGQLLAPATNLGRKLASLAAKIAGIDERPPKRKFSLFGV